MEQFLTAKEVAKRLGVSVAFLGKQRSTGKGIPWVNLAHDKRKRPVVRYSEAEVERYVAEGRN